MKKLYLDTSVPSAVFDLSKKERLYITQKWFDTVLPKFNSYTSALTLNEIDELLTIEKRENIKNLIKEKQLKILEISEEATELSQIYIRKGAIPETEKEDALHVAIATVNKLDVLVSWDFKHIVSVNPIKKIQEVNLKMGYITIEIRTPIMFD